MKKRNNVKLIALGTLLVNAAQAQTVNQGQVYISPGTQFSTVSDLDNIRTKT